MQEINHRHPNVDAIAQYFTFNHLPAGPLRDISRQCHDFAGHMLTELPDSPELIAGLRKLLEAKDCFVRAALHKD